MESYDQCGSGRVETRVSKSRPSSTVLSVFGALVPARPPSALSPKSKQTKERFLNDDQTSGPINVLNPPAIFRLGARLSVPGGPTPLVGPIGARRSIRCDSPTPSFFQVETRGTTTPVDRGGAASTFRHSLPPFRVLDLISSHSSPSFSASSSC